MSTKVFFPNLDGWRFVAALGVVLSHAVGRIPIPENFGLKVFAIILSLDGFAGTAGVSFFFVLSGFLITYLMLVEQEQTGHFSLVNFYLRRILRIWPLYFVTLLIGFVLYPLFHPGFVENASPLLYSLFLANFDNIYNGYPKNGILGIQWSVAVEEQFYLVWPLLFIIFRKSRFLPFVIVSGIIASVFCRIAGLHSYHSLSCIADLFMGAAIAWLSKYKQPWVVGAFRKLSAATTGMVYLAGFLLLLVNFQLHKHFPSYGMIDRFLHSCFFAFIILEQNYSPNSFFKMESAPWAGWLGRISYGIYSLHMVALYFVVWFIGLTSLNIWFIIPLTLFVTIILSYFSYYYYERPFLQLKDKLAVI